LLFVTAAGKTDEPVISGNGLTVI